MESKENSDNEAKSTEIYVFGGFRFLKLLV